MTKEEVLQRIEQREIKCWTMAAAFIENLDAHGLHDMGVEIQALQRAAQEIRKLTY